MADIPQHVTDLLTLAYRLHWGSTVVTRSRQLIATGKAPAETTAGDVLVERAMATLFTDTGIALRLAEDGGYTEESINAAVKHLRGALADLEAAAERQREGATS